MRLIKRLIPIIILILAISLALINIDVEKQSAVYWIIIAYKLFIVAFMTLFIQIVIHELGHVICGVMNNYSFIGFQILGLTISKQNGKLMCRLDGFKNALGLAIMIPNENVTDLNHIKYFRSGYIANLITLIPLFIIFYFGPRLYISIMIAVTVIMIISNIIPRDIGGNFNDGYLIKLFKNKEEEHALAGVYQRLQTELISGIRPRDLEEIPIQMDDNVFAIFINLYMYYKGLDLSDKDMMNTRINQLENSYDILENIQRDSIIYELIFYYCFIAKDSFKATKFYAEIEKRLIKDFDINGRRVLAYYSYFALLDYDKAKRYAEEGLEAADKYPIKGIALMEKDSINHLISIINKSMGM